jgi:hypothetical protein
LCVFQSAAFYTVISLHAVNNDLFPYNTIYKIYAWFTLAIPPGKCNRLNDIAKDFELFTSKTRVAILCASSVICIRLSETQNCYSVKQVLTSVTTTCSKQLRPTLCQ